MALSPLVFSLWESQSGEKQAGGARTRLDLGSLIEGVSRHAPLPFGISFEPGRSDEPVDVTPGACPIPQVGVQVYILVPTRENQAGGINTFSPVPDLLEPSMYN